jgi:hypothetical protein
MDLILSTNRKHFIFVIIRVAVIRIILKLAQSLTICMTGIQKVGGAKDRPKIFGVDRRTIGQN